MAAVGSKRVVALLAAAAVSAGCSVSGGRGGGAGAGRPPAPDITPYRGTPREFVAELQGVVGDLRVPSPGSLPPQEKVSRACTRLRWLRETFLRDIPSRERAGLKDTDFILLFQAARTCPTNPEVAGLTIQELLREMAD